MVWRNLHPYYSTYIVSTIASNRTSASTYTYGDGAPRVSSTTAITISYTIMLPQEQWRTAFDGKLENVMEYPILRH